MEAPLIEVKAVGKRYCRDLKRSLLYGVQDIARECIALPPKQGLRKEEFWANDDISFELRRGECLGLIGGNGAGKSTLLKMIAGLTKPDKGEITVRGRVGALIELGAGFNPILSGRENIYINGSVLGMSKAEIDQKLDAIIDFADIGPFIDSPVQSYSSGMKVRLGFAIAAHMEPDILLIDEVLAVGDAAFRAKCFVRIGKMMQKCAIILVSHHAPQINRTCTKAILLKRGHAMEIGAVDECLASYMRQQSNDNNPFALIEPPITKFQPTLTTLECEESANIKVRIQTTCTQALQIRRLILGVSDLSGETVAASPLHRKIKSIPNKSSTITIELNNLSLANGRYNLSIQMHCSNFHSPLATVRNFAQFDVTNQDFESTSYMPLATVTSNEIH